jgi:DNA-binding MarR family transcriptional regulator
VDSVEKILISLRRMIRAVDLHSRRLAREHGLTVPQLVLLKEIDCADKLTVGELAKRSSISQATVTSILSRLIARDLVIQGPGKDDKRRRELSLTDSGRELLAGTPPLLSDEFALRFMTLATWEQHMILSSMERLADLMDDQQLDAAPLLTTGQLNQAEEPVNGEAS